MQQNNDNNNNHNTHGNHFYSNNHNNHRNDNKRPSIKSVRSRNNRRHNPEAGKPKAHFKAFTRHNKRKCTHIVTQQPRKKPKTKRSKNSNSNTTVDASNNNDTTHPANHNNHNDENSDEFNPFAMFTDTYHNDNETRHINVAMENPINLSDFLPEGMTLEHLQPYVEALKCECKCYYVNREALVIADFDYTTNEINVSFVLFVLFVLFVFFFKKKQH